MHIPYIDLAIVLANAEGCLDASYNFDGVHLGSKHIDILYRCLAKAFFHSKPNTNRYRLLYEKRSAPIDSTLVGSKAGRKFTNLYQDSHIVIADLFADSRAKSILKEIEKSLHFDLSVANTAYRVDWCGNERSAYSQHIKLSLVDQAHMDKVYQLVYDTSLIELLSFSLGYDPCIYAYRPFRSNLHPDEEIGPQAFHHDGCPPGIFRLLIYLTDVDSGSGPFRYYRSDQSICEVTGSSGTAILFDANKLLHAAKPPRTGHRDSLDFCVGPRHLNNPRFVIHSRMNNWPTDPFCFSTHDMIASPMGFDSFLSLSPYPDEAGHNTLKKNPV
jgi:hypothetical protein